LNNIKQVDDHLLGKTEPDEALLFEAKLILDPELNDSVHWHKQTLSLVHQHGREGLRQQIQAVHRQLFTMPQHNSFSQMILRLFKR